MWVDLDGLKLVEFVRKAMKHASLARRLGSSVPLGGCSDQGDAQLSDHRCGVGPDAAPP